MLCSISTGKSGSNWLDRLRSNKGIPTGDDLHLDDFLNNPNPNPSPSLTTIASNSPNSISNSDSTDNPLHNQNRSAAEISSFPGQKEWVGLNVITDVLSELFNIGEPTLRISRKKSSRKQTNPRICITQSPNNIHPVAERSRSDFPGKFQSFKALNSAEAKTELREENDDKVEDEKRKAERELVGYSRSEVTVIDTSCEVWKSDKLVFRRRNVWKVRDKKGKSRTFGRKKRKATGFDGNLLCHKKRKILSSEIQSLKEDHRKELLSPPSHEQNFQDDKCEQDYEDSRDYLSEAPRKRQARKRGSSVIIIKSVPTSKKNGGKLSRNSPMETQRQ